jgi:uncharacterized membrane protein YgdD (TMEM256/DUF423 family)
MPGAPASSTTSRFPLLAAGLFGLSGVALGALGAHALRDVLSERGYTQAWETGARYHLYHALALLGAAIWSRVAARPPRVIRWAVGCWSVGIVLFSGSLYWLALGGPRWLGPVTPLGGVALMFGWGCVLAAAFSRED